MVFLETISVYDDNLAADDIDDEHELLKAIVEFTIVVFPPPLLYTDVDRSIEKLMLVVVAIESYFENVPDKLLLAYIVLA